MSPRSLVSRVHIDTDPGLDDLLALALALASPELRIEGLTTVAGNGDIGSVTENTLRFCELAALDVPVGRGAAAPLVLPPVHAFEVFGSDARRGVKLPPATARELPPAREVLRHSLVERQVDQLIALGPLTNVAALLDDEPELFSDASLVWMGGSLGPGNVTARAEFNCHADPHALARVLASEIDLRIVGLDVTRCVVLRPADLELVPFHPGPRGEFLSAALEALMDAEEVVEGERIALLHDPLAIAAALDADLLRYEIKRLRVGVDDGPERGRLDDLEAGPSTGVRYALEVDHPRMLRMFDERLRAWAGSRKAWRDAL